MTAEELKSAWIEAEQKALDANLAFMGLRAAADAAKERFRKAEREELLKKDTAHA